MAGWNLKRGTITKYVLSEDQIWSLFNYVFSDSSRKRNSYKFGLIKSLIDNLFNGKRVDNGVFFSLKEIFAKFAENYWNLVLKYDLRQMRPDGRSSLSRVEVILKEAAARNSIISGFEFDALPDATKQEIINKVNQECKRCVIGALYEDFDGVIYSFDLKEDRVLLNPCIYEFLLKYKPEIEKLNYYSWARFLEQVNDETVLTRLIDKVEMATPRRENLSVYREILRREFEENTCFYCGKKLAVAVHVDHFIPWSFVKDDKIWNFVLACPTCNTKKNNKIPRQELLAVINERNKKMLTIQNKIIQSDFLAYYDGVINRMWQYARSSGMKIFEQK